MLGSKETDAITDTFLAHKRLARHERHTFIAAPKIGISDQKSSDRDVQTLHETAADKVAVIPNSRGDLPVAIQE